MLRPTVSNRTTIVPACDRQFGSTSPTASAYVWKVVEALLCCGATRVYALDGSFLCVSSTRRKRNIPEADVDRPVHAAWRPQAAMSADKGIGSGADMHHLADRDHFVDLDAEDPNSALISDRYADRRALIEVQVSDCALGFLLVRQIGGERHG